MFNYLFGDTTGMTHEEIKRKREIAAKLSDGIGRPRNLGEGLTAIGAALGARIAGNRASKADASNREGAMAEISSLLNPGQSIFDYGSPSYSSSNYEPTYENPWNMGTTAPLPEPNEVSGNANVFSPDGQMADGQWDMGTEVEPDLASSIVATANAIGADPIDLATVISYETGGTFDPMQPGPTTQWGQHRGLIQFGQPQAQQHGVDFSTREVALRSQLGPDGAVASYLRSAGYQPGMGLMDLYSTINAGAPGRFSASDANNGGAPGTVADKVNNQMAGHRAKAMALLGQGNGEVMSTSNRQPTLGMIGGVKGPGQYWQSLDGSGTAHASNPGYTDYSQLFREYTFDPKPGYVPVGERDGRTVYAAPDYMRGEDGNYVNVSASQAQAMAQERGLLIPTRDEYKNLAQQAHHIAMPTFANGNGDPAAYTQQVMAQMEGVQGPVLHGKEFFADGTMTGGADTPSVMGQQGADVLYANRLNWADPRNFQQGTARDQQPQRAPQQPQPQGFQMPRYTGPSEAQIMQVLNNPYATPAQRAQAEYLLKVQRQYNDPMYRMQMQEQWNKLNTPDRKTAKDANDRLRYVDNGEYVFNDPSLEGAGGDATEYGLTPQYYTNAEGQLKMGVLGKDGTFKEVDLPEGAAIEKGVQKLDLGTHFQWYNNITGEPIGNPIPKDVRGEESEKVAGRVEGEARAQANLDLPATISEAETAIALIDSIIEDENLPGVLGKIEGTVEPGTLAGRVLLNQAETDLIPKIEQLQGKAFLQAFETLKGGGQITEREGLAAQNAIARLQRTQSPEAYKQALRDLRDIVSSGLERARQSANASGPQVKGYSSYAEFEANPEVRAQAEKYGVTVEEMWDIYQESGQ